MSKLAGRLKIDEKHHIEVTAGEVIGVIIRIIKSTNGQAIPEEEPTILFRGRDRLALPMLEHYRQLCQADGATPYQLESMDVMIGKFRDFADLHPETMKQPGCMKGA